MPQIENDQEATFQHDPHDAEHPFLMVSRALIRDQSISPECRWLIIYLLSHKEGFVIKIKQVVNHCTGHIGKDAVYRIVKEAIEAGYIKREEKNVDNLKRVRYFVSESPKFKKSLPRPENQDAEIQDPENPPIKKEYPEGKTSKEYSLVPPSGGTAESPLSKKEPNGEAMAISELLLERVLSVHPKAKKPNMVSWALEIDKAIRLDHRTPEELRKAIEFSFEDSFWAKTLQSAEGLRRNFDKIWAKMTPISNSGTRIKTNTETARKIKEVLSQSNDSNLLLIYSTHVTNKLTADSVSLEINPEQFENVLINWFGLRKK